MRKRSPLSFDFKMGWIPNQLKTPDKFPCEFVATKGSPGLLIEGDRHSITASGPMNQIKEPEKRFISSYYEYVGSPKAIK